MSAYEPAFRPACIAPPLPVVPELAGEARRRDPASLFPVRSRGFPVPADFFPCYAATFPCYPGTVKNHLFTC